MNKLKLRQVFRSESWLLIVLVAACLWFAQTSRASTQSDNSQRSYFIGVDSFKDFAPVSSSSTGDIILLSPEYSAPVDWDELVVSWNVVKGAALTIEAKPIFTDHVSHFYNMGEWSDNIVSHLRQSTTKQNDADASVKTDTLTLKHPAVKVQIRLTLHNISLNKITDLKFLGLSFCNRNMKVSTDGVPAKSTAWGRVIQVPELKQGDYEGGGGWCSPTSLAMDLTYWADMLKRPELKHSVPEVANAINDVNLPGTGNWPFNTAYAGTFEGIRAYVTRFDDTIELEKWIRSGIPVIVSVSSYLTRDRHFGPDNGHLIVCVGFDENGDVITNDPGVSTKPEVRARRTYPRVRFCRAWAKSGNTVYLIYPVGKAVPEDLMHHWEGIKSLSAAKK
jgi:hypothetical protein